VGTCTQQIIEVIHIDKMLSKERRGGRWQHMFHFNLWRNMFNRSLCSNTSRGNGITSMHQTLDLNCEKTKLERDNTVKH
jgi:hypothetical protein